jgi:hypothetical protein
VKDTGEREDTEGTKGDVSGGDKGPGARTEEGNGAAEGAGEGIAAGGQDRLGGGGLGEDGNPGEQGQGTDRANWLAVVAGVELGDRIEKDRLRRGGARQLLAASGAV